MKQVFDDADRAKKKARLPPSETTSKTPRLINVIKTSLADGYLPCALAFEIAKKLKVVPLTVGNAADELGIRITECQIDCFKVNKKVHDSTKAVKPEITMAVESENNKSPLTCAAAFGLAKRLKISPLEVANAANAAHVKFHNCQLGCF